MALDDGRIMPNLILQAICGGPLTVYDSGEQTRSLCYVDDAIRGLVSMATVNLPPEPGHPTILNLGSRDERTVNEIAEMVWRLVGGRDGVTPIVRRDLPEGDVPRRLPETTHALSWLGWECEVPLEDGIVRMAEDTRWRL